MGVLLIGTCGYSYKEWIGPFYPAGTKEDGFLVYYSGLFPTVELDYTYYKMPTSKSFSEQLVSEKFFLLGLFPYLSFKEIDPNWKQSAAKILKGFIEDYPGRADLFETYVAQGLPLDVEMFDVEGRTGLLTPLDYILHNEYTDSGGSGLYDRHGADTMGNLEILIHKLGNIHPDSKYLRWAIMGQRPSLAKQYLALGADVNEDPEILIEAASRNDYVEYKTTEIFRHLLDSGATKKTIQEAIKKAKKMRCGKNFLFLLEDAEKGKVPTVPGMLVTKDDKLANPLGVTGTVSGNAPGNISNGGFVAVQDEWLYYNNKFVKAFYKMRTDGTGRQRLNKDWCAALIVVGDWVYYTNRNDKDKLYRIRTDGKDRKKIVNNECEEIGAAGGWVYYTLYGDPEKLNRIQV
jgi:hypothetical protein